MAQAKQADKHYDFLIKLLLIGDSGVGKSSILARFADDSFSQTFITTIGIDFKIRTITLDDKRIKLQIWDTAGQERFRTITTAYYRGAMGILLVYDVTNQASFDSISGWMRAIEQHASDTVNKVLLGNKADTSGSLASARRVSTEQGQARPRLLQLTRTGRLAAEYNLKFFETSAKNDINVENAFFTIARDIKHRITTTAAAPASGGMKLGSGGTSSSGSSTKKGCC